MLKGLKGKELEEYLILNALGEVYAEHSDLATYEALNEEPPRFLDDDSIWEPLEDYDAEYIRDLVRDEIRSLRSTIEFVTSEVK